MKILALMTGRPKGVSEAYSKHILLGAKERGAEVEVINLFDTTIKGCIGCSSCSKKGGGRGGAAFNCFHDDDFNWVADKILESDGLAVVMPMYEKYAPGVFKTLCDRIGPYFDVAFAATHKELILRGEREGKLPDERLFKTRPVAFIAHGGSEWTTLGLATMQVFSISLGLQTVYRKTINWDSDSWMRDERFEELQSVGRHLADCVGKDSGDMPYIGDKGHCPVCHNDVLLLGQNNGEAICAVCGLEGAVTAKNGGVAFTARPEDYHKSHVTITGKEIHDRDLDDITKTIMAMDMEKLKQRKSELDWLGFSRPQKKQLRRTKMDVSRYLDFGDAELRRRNLETIVKYISSRTDEERSNRWKLFTEDGRGGYTSPGPHDTPDKTELGHPGHEGLRASDAWNLEFFPEYRMEDNVIFQTQDPNVFVVTSNGKGYINFPAYGKKPYENFFFHRFLMQDGLIKEYREHMNFCEVFHALGVPLPEVRFPGK